MTGSDTNTADIREVNFHCRAAGHKLSRHVTREVGLYSNTLVQRLYRPSARHDAVRSTAAIQQVLSWRVKGTKMTR